MTRRGLRRAPGIAGEHLAVLLIAMVVWFASILLNAVLRTTLYIPLIPGDLVLFALAFWMTVRTRDAILALVSAAAWVGFGINSFVINYDSLTNSHFSHELARLMLADSLEAALVMLAGGALGIAWLRRGARSGLATS